MAGNSKKGWPEVDADRLLTAAERVTVIGLVVYVVVDIIRPGIGAILGF